MEPIHWLFLKPCQFLTCCHLGVMCTGSSISIYLTLTWNSWMPTGHELTWFYRQSRWFEGSMCVFIGTYCLHVHCWLSHRIINCIRITLLSGLHLGNAYMRTEQFNQLPPKRFISNHVNKEINAMIYIDKLIPDGIRVRQSVRAYIVHDSIGGG